MSPPRWSELRTSARVLSAVLALSLVALTSCTAVGDTSATEEPTTATTPTAVAELPSAGAEAPTAPASTPALTSTPPPTQAWAPPLHRIIIVDGAFVDTTTNALFIPRGVNYFDITAGVDRAIDPTVFDPVVIGAAFERLEALGYNTVRLFLDTCQCSTSTTGISAGYIETLVQVLELAADHGLVLVLTSNDIPDGGGYGGAANAQAIPGVIEGYRNAHFLTTSGHRAIARYWGDLLAELVAHEARLDVVLGWSILNEQWLFATEPPLSLTQGTIETRAGIYDMADPLQRRAMVTDNVRLMIADVAAAIRGHDPDALVTMGFFAPKFPNATEIGGFRYVDTEPLIRNSTLDFFDLHTYPGEDLSIAEIAENFGIAEDKPVIMGEVGGFVDTYSSAGAAALAVQEWIAASCEVGYDGWLYWGYLRAPLSDATWALTDADDLLLNQLAPVNQPDPCTTTLTDPNIARNASVAASASLPDAPPERAVDSDPETAWVAGNGPTQWIEVQFDAPAEVETILLRVDQAPPGPTVHEVLVRFGDGTASTVHTFDGQTDFGDVLAQHFEPFLNDVVAIRITTLLSPSWVAWGDIQVLRPQ